MRFTLARNSTPRINTLAIDDLNEDSSNLISDPSSDTIKAPKTTKAPKKKIASDHKVELKALKCLTALELLAEQSARTYMSTGSREIDRLLGDKGLQTSTVTLVSGAQNSGKTQFCLTAIMSLLKTSSSSKIAYIDVENKFRADAVKNLALKNGLDPLGVLSAVLVIKPDSTEEIQRALEFIEPTVSPSKSSERTPLNRTPNLVIIDGLFSHLKFITNQKPLKAQHKATFKQILETCCRYAKTHDAFMLLTDGFCTSLTTELTKEIDYKLFFKKLKYHHIAEIQQCASLPHGQAPFAITSRGISDLEYELSALPKPTTLDLP